MNIFTLEKKVRASKGKHVYILKSLMYLQVLLFQLQVIQEVDESLH